MKSKFFLVITILAMVFNIIPPVSGQASQSQPAEPAAAKLSSPAAQMFSRLQAKAQQEGVVRVIVELQTGVAEEDRRTLSPEALRSAYALAQDELLNQITFENIDAVSRFDDLPYLALSVTPEGLSEIKASGKVLGIYEDHKNRISLSASAPLVGAASAWSSGYTGSGWTVAVLDTGFDLTHPFISSKIVSEACYSGGGYTTYSLCPDGVTSSTASGSSAYDPDFLSAGSDHGTHVAGIAAGAGTTYNGIAKGANLITINVFSQDGEDIGAYDSDIIKGLQRVYALSSTYNIASVNLSLGGGSYSSYCDSESPPMKTAIDNLATKNIAVVIASGNDGAFTSMDFPACISSAVSVGSTTKTDDISSFSNTASFLSLYAPGSNICSSVPGGGYECWNGTSMATPHVAGAWALIKQKSASATVSQALAALRNTGVAITGRSLTIPRIQVDAAINSFSSGSTPAAPSSLNAALSGSNVALSWSDNSSNETGFLIQRSIGGTTSWTNLATTAANTTSYTDTSAPCGRTVYYQVRANGSSGNSAFSNTDSVVTPACTTTTPTAVPSASPTPTNTPQPTPTPAPTQPYAPVPIYVSPSRVEYSSGATLHVWGYYFGSTTGLTLGNIQLQNVTLVSPYHLSAYLPAGALAAGVHNLAACHPTKGCNILRNAVAVIDTRPSVTSFTPTESFTDVGGMITLYGSNFKNGMEIYLGGVLLPNRGVVSSSQAYAYFSAGQFAAGSYQIEVRNPVDGQQPVAAPGQFTFVTPSEDGVELREESLWTSPVSLHPQQTATIYATVYRLGGSSSRVVDVSFNQFDPDLGTVDLITDQIEIPAGAGSYAAAEATFTVPSPPQTSVAFLVIVTDPDTGEVLASGQKSFPIVPAEDDTTPPEIFSLIVNDDYLWTEEAEVNVQLDAYDDTGVSWMYLVPMQFESSARRWVPVVEPAWVPFTAATTITLPKGGMVKVIAWVADEAGNVSEAAETPVFNFLPTGETIQQGEVHLYRFTLYSGESLTLDLQTLSGDADIYAWGTDGSRSRSVNAGADPDEVTLYAYKKTTYVVEVYGYRASTYTLSVPDEPWFQQVDESVYIAEKDRSAPVILPSTDPGAAISPPDSPFKDAITGNSNRIFLPVILGD